MIERLAIHEHLAGIHPGGRVPGSNPAGLDAAPLDPVAYLASGAVAQAGQELVDALHPGPDLAFLPVERKPWPHAIWADAKNWLGIMAVIWDGFSSRYIMAVWEYKVISSGKGGFATPALLESYLNQLGTDEWEIIEFRGQPDNPLAFSGLARRSTQRDWTLGAAVAAAAKAEAEKLRIEFEAKFRSATAVAAAPEAEAPVAEAGREVDGLRRLRDTENDSDPDAADTPEEDWDKLGSEEDLPTFFEALRPHLRRNQRGPGMSVGVDYLAKKWDISEDDVLGALKECGLEIPEDEDAPVTYVDYDGDLFWVNVNRRGELWINTKEKPRPVFRTVKAERVQPEEAGAPSGAPAEAPAAPQQEPRRQRPPRNEPPQDSSAPAAPLPGGPELLDRIRPHMRKNRREPGGSGSMSFLSRALRTSEASLVQAFQAMGLNAETGPNEPPVFVEIGEETWFLNKDSRGGIWINARERRAEGAPAAESAPSGSSEAPSGAPEAPAPAPGNVFAALRLLLKETKSGGVAAPVDRLAAELGKSSDELLLALTSSGLQVPEKSREKPVFGEHAGEIFWLNRNAKGELWLNAKASKYADDDGRNRRRPKKKGPDDGAGSPEAAPEAVQEPAPQAPAETPPQEPPAAS